MSGEWLVAFVEWGEPLPFAGDVDVGLVAKDNFGFALGDFFTGGNGGNRNSRNQFDWDNDRYNDPFNNPQNPKSSEGNAAIKSMSETKSFLAEPRA